MELNTLLANFYESYNEDDRLTSRHGQVEYRTTMHFITKYLTPGCRIEEIGALRNVLPVRQLHYVAVDIFAKNG